MEEFQITKHMSVPEHIKLTDEEVQELLKKYNISLRQLPMIFISDPTIKNVGFKVGDVLKIIRSKKNPKESDFYRVVIDG